MDTVFPTIFLQQHTSVLMLIRQTAFNSASGLFSYRNLFLPLTQYPILKGDYTNIVVLLGRMAHLPSK